MVFWIFIVFIGMKLDFCDVEGSKKCGKGDS